MLVLVGTVVVFCIGWFLLVHGRGRKGELRLSGRHVLITGGSSGIGLAMAREVLHRSPLRLTLLARDSTGLAAARDSLLPLAQRSGTEINLVPLDVTAPYEEIEKTLNDEHKVGVVDVLINCAGSAKAQTFDSASADVCDRMVNLNYLGAAHVTKALLRGMLNSPSPTERRIAFVSSLAALLPVYGFSAYAASKSALAVFAGILRQELEGIGPAVTVVYPPDTNTPGLQAENVGKPEITRIISGAAGLVPPEKVAERAIHDILVGRRNSTLGLTGRALVWATAGCSRIQEDCPLPAPLVMLLEVILAPFFKCALFAFAYWCRLCILWSRRKNQQ